MSAHFLKWGDIDLNSCNINNKDKSNLDILNSYGELQKNLKGHIPLLNKSNRNSHL